MHSQSASHANSNDAFRQSDPSIARCTVHCSWASCWARPCPWRRKRWMPSGWRGRQHGRLARRCQPSRAGRADRFRQRDVARRRCGGGHRQHLCRAQARPDRHRRQRRLSAAQNMSVAGSMCCRAARRPRSPTTRITRFPNGGAARGARDDRANRRQSRGGRGPGRADGSRHGILRRGPYASARAGAASLEVGRNLSVGGDFVIDAAPVGVMLVSSGSGAAQALRGYPGDGGRRRIRRGPPGCSAVRPWRKTNRPRMFWPRPGGVPSCWTWAASWP